jgi:tetratricopeptide (TPR) repeat protein
MTRLPIQGRGLDAIIRDTLAEPLEQPADPAQIAEAKAEQEREKARTIALEKTVADRDALAEKLKAQIAKLADESQSLRRTLDTEIPQGQARELLMETLEKGAKEFDQAGNLLDAFHLYRRVLRFDPQNIHALYEIATIYYSAGILPQSAESLRLILEIDPAQKKAKESLEAIEEEMGGG